MRKILLLLAMLLVPIGTAFGQGTVTHVRSGGTLPALCSPTTGDVFFLTTPNPTIGLYACTATNSWALASGGAGGGSVTSVSLSLPSIFNVTGSPVTTSGTLAATLANQSANTGLFGPTSGGAAAPTFRSLVGADIPAINLAASGAGGVTGNLSISNLCSGTGASSTTFLRGDCTWSVPITAIPWSSLLAPSVNLSLSHGTNQTLMTWGNTGANTPWSMTFGAVTGNANQFSIADTTGSTNTLPLVNINTVGTSTALPLQVTTQGTANGVQVDLAGNLKPIGTGLITGTQVVNVQTGITYTFVTTDRAKLVTLTNASSIAVTLPQAGLLFPSAWYVDVQNRGPGNVTITPTTSTIDGVASIILQSSQGLRITSDGTNYFTQRGAGSGSGSPVYTTVTFTTTPVFTVSGTGPNSFKITLTGNVTSSTLTNAASGQQLEFDICQDATGGRTFVFPTNVLGAPAISSGASACTRETFLYDGVNANFNGFGAGPPVYTTVSFSATPTFTASSNGPNGFKITLTGNVTSSTLAGAVAGQQLEFDICQDGTGGRTFIFPANVVGASPIASAASACTREIFTFDGTNANPSAAPLAADNTWLSPQRFKNGPLYDVTAYGASGSIQNTTGSITSGTSILTLAAALDFQNGQGVIINGGGPGNAPLSCTINSGAGTVTLTLGCTATTTATSVAVDHDDVAAINAAAVAVSTISPSPGTLFFPCGSYVVASAPVYIKSGSRMPILGQSRDCVSFVKSNALGSFGYDGPGMVVTSNALAVNPVSGTALLTGTGGSFQLDQQTTTFFDLRDSRFAGDWNGLAQLAMEATVKINSLSPAFGTFIVSSGKRDSIDGQRRAGRLGVYSNGQLECIMNVAGTTVTLTSATGAMVVGNTYHIACTYDGATVRLYLAGVHQQGTAATGTITQAITEMVHVGREDGFFGEIGQLNPPASANIDGVRISNVARYTGTGSFTPPTAKWGTADANTLVQLNFDNQPTGTNFTVGRTGIGDRANEAVYLPLHNSCPPPVAFSISQIKFGGSDGIYLQTGGNLSQMSDVSLNSVHNGVFLAPCGFLADFAHIGVSANGRYGLLLAGGINRVEHMNFSGNAAYLEYTVGPSGDFEDQLFGVTQGNVILESHIGAGTIAPNPKIDFSNIDFENADTAFVTGLMLDGMNSAIVLNSFLVANGGTTQPAVTVQGGTAVTFLNNEFAAAPSGTSIVHVTSPAPTQPIVFLNNRQNSGVPWTDVAGTFVVFGGLTNINGPKGSPGPANGGDRTAALDITAFPVVQELPNEAATGTFVGIAVKPTGAPSTAIVTASTDTRGALGCVVAGQGKTGQVQIATLGQASCVSDNATVAGDYMTLSATQAGALHDAGSTYPTSGQVIGRVLATAPLQSALTSTSASCPSTGGTYAAGTYQVSTTGVNFAGQETLVARTTVVCSGTTSRLTATPGGYGATGQPPGYRVYVSAVGGAPGTELLQTFTSTTCNGGLSADPKTLLTTPTGNACSTFISGFGNTALVTGGAAIPGANNSGPLVNTFLYPFDIAGGTGGGGLPCTTTALSAQYNAAGSLGCISNFTWTAATGVHNFSQLANGNSTHKHSRFTNTSPTGFFQEFTNTGGGTTLASLDVLGNYLANTYTANGTGAGALGLSQGATRTTADCPTGGPNCVLHQAPTAVTAHMVTWPGVAAKGVLRGTTSGSGVTLTETISYDADLKTCMIVVGADNGTALVDLDLGPQRKICQVPYTATVTEIEIASDAGTPNVIVAKRHCTASPCSAANETRTNLTSSALATGTSGATACSNTGGTTGFDTFTTCTNTLQNTALAVGDWIELTSGTAGGVAVRVSIAVHITR